VLKMLTKFEIFLIGWLRILMNMRLVALIHTSHPLASLIMLLHCSDCNSNSYSYYISDEGFARLRNMIEKMNKQQI